MLRTKNPGLEFWMQSSESDELLDELEDEGEIEGDMDGWLEDMNSPQDVEDMMDNDTHKNEQNDGMLHLNAELETLISE